MGMDFTASAISDMAFICDMMSYTLDLLSLTLFQYRYELMFVKSCPLLSRCVSTHVAGTLLYIRFLTEFMTLFWFCRNRVMSAALAKFSDDRSSMK